MGRSNSRDLHACSKIANELSCESKLKSYVIPKPLQATEGPLRQPQHLLPLTGLPRQPEAARIGPLLGIFVRIPARLVPRHKSRVVLEHVIQVIGIHRERFAAIWVLSHAPKWQWLDRIPVRGVKIHIFLIAIRHEEIIADPALRDWRQLGGIEIELNFFT